MERIDDFGGPKAYNHYAVGWAHAMDTPYQWTKQVASHWGGTRNGTIVHWPKGINAKGETRSQFHHVIDVAPTILEAAWLPHPTIVNSSQQKPLHGFSMAYSFDDAKAPDRHETQYFEMFVNRGIYHKGWTAVTRHSTPWVVAPLPPYDDDVWELYAPDDWTQSQNSQRRIPRSCATSSAFPHRSDEVQRAAARRPAGRALQLRHRRSPDAHQGQYAVAVRRHGPAVRELGHLNLKNKSHSITAQVDRSRGGARRRDRRAGRQFRRMDALRKGRQADLLLQLFGSSRSSCAATSRSPPATIKCAWSLHTTAVASAKEAPSRSTLTEEGRRGPGRDDGPDDVLRRRDLRRRQRHGHALSAASTASMTASSTARC